MYGHPSHFFFDHIFFEARVLLSPPTVQYRMSSVNVGLLLDVIGHVRKNTVRRSPINPTTLRTITRITTNRIAYSAMSMCLRTITLYITFCSLMKSYSGSQLVGNTRRSFLRGS